MGTSSRQYHSNALDFQIRQINIYMRNLRQTDELYTAENNWGALLV